MLDFEFLVTAITVSMLEPSYIVGRNPYTNFDLQNSNDRVSLDSLNSKVYSLANEA